MTHEQRPGFGKGKCMIYYDTVKRQLTQQELDGNFEQLMLRAKRLGAQDMPITLRKDLTRPLTPREMDTNFQSLELAVKKARYGDGPYPAAEYIFDGATVLPVGITFSRSGTATYIKNGRILTAGVDEPVFERGGLRVWPSVTNYSPNFLSPSWEAGTGVAEVTRGVQDIGGGSSAIRAIGLRGVGDSATGSNIRFLEFRAPADGPITFSAWVRKIGGEGVPRFRLQSERSSPSKSDGSWEFVSVTHHYTEAQGVRVIIGSEEGAMDVELCFPQIQMGSIANPYVPTSEDPETMPADNASILGAAFSSIFNPNQGALVLPHSSYGEGNIITLGGLQVARTEDGLELNNTAIPDTEDAKQNLKLRWGSNGLDVFVGNTKALHDIPLPANWGDADSLVLADNDSAGKYIDRLAMLTEAPTGSNMEGM